MSEKLTIEILKQKFKEAQEKEFELFLTDGVNEIEVLYLGRYGIYVNKHSNECAMGYHELDNWQIKQPKDEYDVFYSNRFEQDSVGRLVIRYSLFWTETTDKRFCVLKNKRTGEICEYDEKLIKGER